MRTLSFPLHCFLWLLVPSQCHWESTVETQGRGKTSHQTLGFFFSCAYALPAWDIAPNLLPTFPTWASLWAQSVELACSVSGLPCWAAFQQSTSRSAVRFHDGTHTCICSWANKPILNFFTFLWANITLIHLWLSMVTSWSHNLQIS